MPDSDARRPVRAHTTLTDLAGGRAIATPDPLAPGRVTAAIGDANAYVSLVDTAPVLRRRSACAQNAI